MAGAAHKTVYVVAGPTASGKSALALALADHVGGAIVNGDSMQIYKGLEILTAQPAAAARARAPHCLYGVMDPAIPCSAGKWRDMAVKEINRIHGEGGTPIVTGGSGLYLKALMEGIAPVPDIPDDIRRRLRARFDEMGTEAFRAALLERDPESAAIGASDSQRLIRAMEVVEATGQSLGAWQALPADGPDPKWRFVSILLDPPRAELYTAIEDRFDRMMEAGALDEAMALAECGLAADLPAMKALGVGDLIRAGRGEIPLETAVLAVKTASRNYAKRQVTWFRRQIITDFTLSEKFSERFNEKILSYIL